MLLTSFNRLVYTFHAQVRGVWLLASLMAYASGVVQFDDLADELARTAPYGFA